MSNSNNIYNTIDPPKSFPGGAGSPPFALPPFSPHPQYPPMPPIYIQQPSVGCAGYLFRFVMGVLFFFGTCIAILFFIGFIIGFAASLEGITDLENNLSERVISGTSTAKSKIAVITISGLIIESENGYIPKQIKQALKDKSVKGIVLRVDSPGGTMTGSDYYLHLLKNLKEERSIPIIVSMGSMAASGGYYVSMASDEIFAEPTTVTGSIGVIVPMYKGVGLCEKIGVESTPITSGPLKTMGSFDKPLTDEQRAVWQNLVDDNFALFKKVIRDCRSEFEKEPEKLDKLATGQIYTANDALKNGLIDKIGYLDDAVEAVRKKTGLTESNSKTIRYRSKPSVSDIFSVESAETILSAKTVLNLTIPKVYLLVPDVLPLTTEK
ncbi:MAG: signal peptide peptidase SppA [Planctomycetaceae bacterium]|nr:signal peptide peptidase SppA [Planctomycetaceae bacterium]